MPSQNAHHIGGLINRLLVESNAERTAVKEDLEFLLQVVEKRLQELVAKLPKGKA